MDQDPGARTRIDKWLWAARFFKTRSLATDAVEGGKVRINGLGVKPAKDVRPGDRVAFSNGPVAREVVVRAIADKRGPATVAQQLYEETPESLAARAAMADERRLKVEPAADRHGRPTKRERRDYERWRE